MIQQRRRRIVGAVQTRSNSNELTTSVVESKNMTNNLSCLRQKRFAVSILNKENDVANEKSNSSSSSSSKTKRGSKSTKRARILPPMEKILVETSDPLAAADAEPLSDSRQTVSTTTMAAAVLQTPSTISLHDDSIGNVANPLWCVTAVDELNLPTIIKGPFSFASPTHSASDKETKDADGIKCSSLASSSSSTSSSSMSVSFLPDLGEPPNTTTTTTKACATTTTASKNKRTTVKPATKRSKKASTTMLTTTTTTTTSTTMLEPNSPHQCRYEPDIPMSKEELKQWRLQAAAKNQTTHYQTGRAMTEKQPKTQFVAVFWKRQGARANQHQDPKTLTWTTKKKDQMCIKVMR